MNHCRSARHAALRTALNAASTAALMLVLAACGSPAVLEPGRAAETVTSFEEASDWDSPDCAPGDDITTETLNAQELPALCRVDDTDLVFPDGGRIDVHGGESGSISRTIDGVESVYGYFAVGPEGLVGYRQLLDSGEVVEWYGSPAGIELVTDAFGSNLEHA